MTSPTTHYRGQEITFATMHGKELLARNVFQRILGANVTAPAGLDTDQFGTFAGDIPRTLSPKDACRVKARLGMQIAGNPLGLASEGSFSTTFGPLVEHMEILMFIDENLGLEMIEGTITTSPLPGGRTLHTSAQARSYAETLGFPNQGIILQTTTSGITIPHKNLLDLEQVESTVEKHLARGFAVTILPDYRAHRAPTRAHTIRALSSQMAGLLATACPTCATPGYGQINVEPGLPCSGCGTKTRLIAADIHGCGRCDHQNRIPRPQTHADPRWCDACNP